MEPIHIYAKQQSSRLTYIADYFFTTLLPFEKIIFYTHIDSFQAAQGIKLNYSNQNISDVLQIIPHTILFEDAIAPQSFKVEKWNGMKAFFKTGNDSLPFDLLAASFYLITRYEEYLPFEADAHQRFPANQSLAYRENFLHLPLIQYYANILYSNLAAKHNLPPTPDKTVINSPGIDVDNAYAYLHKGATRTLGGIGKDMLKFDFANLAHRIRSLLTNKDPYDTYEFILRSCKEQSVTPTFFLMTANQGTYDRNLPHTNATYIKLIQQLSLQATTGLHPGYTSDELQILKTETARLEEITGASIVNSRQHFLKIKFPSTYNNLISCGIQNDYSMGYADACGFRASTAVPFYFFDLEKNTETELLVHPIAYMDATFVFYQKKPPVQAWHEINNLHMEVKKFGGLFHYIWHNETVNDQGMWKGWQQIFLKTLQLK